MSINVALETFEGPLDLLLQLVRRSQISVWEIRIQKICEQFIAYTRQLEQLDVEQAGEFLVMASTLIRIKARLLLPRPEPELDNEEEPVDEEEALITRLLLYEGYREAAEALEQMAQTSLAAYPRGQVYELPPRQAGDPLAGISILSLAVMAQQAYQELAQTRVVRVETESHTVGEQMAYIMHRLLDPQTTCSFWELLTTQATREEIVTTFLAVLELVRLHRIKVWQDDRCSQIMIRRGSADEAV